jgi:hypothetical protein
MIRCLCPTCRAVLEFPDHKAGTKIPCPVCSQRLLIPPPVRSHTVLGQPLPTSATPQPAIQPPTCQAWLVKSYGDERSYGGNDGYPEEPSTYYHYDNFVPCHRQVAKGHVLVLLGRDRLLGLARIEQIDSQPGKKIWRRCPTCGTADLSSRRRRRPLFRCDNGHEFDEPHEEEVACTRYTAHYPTTFIAAQSNIPWERLRAACTRYNRQNAIQRIDLLSLEPEIRRAVPEAIRFLNGLPEPATPELGDQAAGEEEGTNRSPIGQGFIADPVARKAVELRAMELAAAWYQGAGYEVEDTSAVRPFDLLCRRAEEAVHVEVKGTTGAGESVNLTCNEVNHARRPGVRTDLFVVGHIEVIRCGGVVRANGGEVVAHVRGWVPSEEDLTPMQFEYRIPPSPDGITSSTR